MNLKKTYTMVPECSLGETFNCNKNCSCCDKATKIKYGIVQVPENIPIPLTATIDNDFLYSGEHTHIRISYDKPIDIKRLKVTVGPGLKVEEIRYDKDTLHAVVKISGTEERVGLVNAAVTYAGITRLFQVKVAIAPPEILEVALKPARVRIGEPVLVNIILNRVLRYDESAPTLTLEEDKVSLTQPIKINGIAKEVYNCTITPIIEVGFAKIGVKFENGNTKYVTLEVYEDEELLWATKEDIDALFPELDNDGGVIVPDPDQPPLVVEWADEEDIDALFPELMGTDK